MKGVNGDLFSHLAGLSAVFLLMAVMVHIPFLLYIIYLQAIKPYNRHPPNFWS
jgi:hypothetical protein